MLMINIKQTLGSLLVIGKRVLRIIMLYPLFQNGFTGSVEAVKFIQEVTGQEDISISQQDIGKQRGYLSPILYKDMFKDYNY